MKKMLAKAVVLGLVLGGIGFVANDAQAAEITDGVKVFSGKKVEILGIYGCDVKTENELEKDTALANQNDLKAVNDKPYPLSRTFLREREKQQFLPEPLLLSFY